MLPPSIEKEGRKLTRGNFPLAAGIL